MRTPLLISLAMLAACSDPNPLYFASASSSGGTDPTGAVTGLPTETAPETSETLSTTSTSGTSVGATTESASQTTASSGEGTDTGSSSSDTGTMVTCDGGGGAMCHDPQTYLPGVSPTVLDVADYDGSGDIDIVVADETADLVVLMTNAGGGLFGAEEPVEVPGARPMGVCFANLDGALPLEIVTADRDTRSMSVLAVETKASYVLDTVVDMNGQRIEDCAVLDVDGDGDEDVVGAAREVHALAVSLNDGAGTLAAATEFMVLDQPASVWAADIDGNGFGDLGAAHTGGQGVSFHLGSATGELTSASYESAEVQFGVHVADLDGNGMADLISSRPEAGVVVIYWDVLNAGKEPSVLVETVGQRPGNLTTGDFNADGALDVAVAVEDSDRLAILSGVGFREFAVTSIDLGGSPFDIASADLNGDTIDDVALTLPGSGELVVYLSTATRI